MVELSLEIITSNVRMSCLSPLEIASNRGLSCVRLPKSGFRAGVKCRQIALICLHLAGVNKMKSGIWKSADELPTPGVGDAFSQIDLNGSFESLRR